jgi:hypothetical protein
MNHHRKLHAPRTAIRVSASLTRLTRGAQP